jgi:hypothetical protein
MKNNKNGTTERIHGQKVKIGKGLGKQTMKRAKGAVKGYAEKREATLKELFPD